MGEKRLAKQKASDMHRHLASGDTKIPVDGVELAGIVSLPAATQGVVVFAHGSGSSRLSPRNLYVAGTLQQAGFGTVLVDLLTPVEEAADERGASIRFDIALLARRLAGLTSWLADWLAASPRPIGYFGASTGAAAALVAAAHTPDRIAAVVSRGGRPDLAGDALERVKAPTLLIVGGEDSVVLNLNRRAMQRLRTTTDLTVVPGATHLFEEPGALDRVAELSVVWFRRYMPYISVSP